MVKRIVIAVAVSVSLVACGGGGGGDSPVGTAPTSSIQRIDSFDPLQGSSDRAAIVAIYRVDFNGDGVDEVVIAGRMTAVDITDHLGSAIQIYGWNTGRFSNETTTWMPNNLNLILGTEPAVKFADFDGDTVTDMFVAPGTDIELYGPAVLYLNRGGRFERQDLDLGRTWSHDAAVADFNGDGIADVFVCDYNGRSSLLLGQPSAPMRIYRGVDHTPGCSGASAADYMRDGTVTILLTDSGMTGVSDSHLYSWSIADDQLRLTQIAALPESRFYLSKYQHLNRWHSTQNPGGIGPHEIRNVSFDFDADGDPDAIVFSTFPKDGVSAHHGLSEIQFLRNDGNGIFVDVTDSMLVDYNTNRTTSYNAVMIDLNDDGLIDLFLSETDYTNQSSTAVLFRTKDGTFVERYSDMFDWFQKAIDSNFVTGVAKGPDQKKFLIGLVPSYGNDVRFTVYLSEITFLSK